MIKAYNEGRCKKMVGERKSKKLDPVSLSATSVKRRIVDKSHDVL